MNKEEVIKLLEKLNFPKEEFYILSSGCLLFYGLREKAGDLDLCISEKLFEKIKEKYKLKEEKKNSCGFYKLQDKVEVVVDNPEEFQGSFTTKDGYQLQKLEIILRDKIKRNLPKDQNDIKNIIKYLEDLSREEI